MNSNQNSPTDQRRHWHGEPGNRHEHQNVWVIGRPPQNYASVTSVDYTLGRSPSATSQTTPDLGTSPTAAIANANMTTRRVLRPSTSLDVANNTGRTLTPAPPDPTASARPTPAREDAPAPLHLARPVCSRRCRIRNAMPQIRLGQRGGQVGRSRIRKGVSFRNGGIPILGVHSVTLV